jgi:anti-sigma B factor antagonist
MAKPNVTITTRKVGEGIGIIDIQGEINAFAEDALMEAYTTANNAGARAIVLNFVGLTYMNSSGIGLLVTLLVRAKRQKQRFLAFGLSEHYRKIFELTRLSEAITLYGSEAEALAALGKASEPEAEVIVW